MTRFSVSLSAFLWKPYDLYSELLVEWLISILLLELVRYKLGCGVYLIKGGLNRVNWAWLALDEWRMGQI